MPATVPFRRRCARSHAMHVEKEAGSVDVDKVAASMSAPAGTPDSLVSGLPDILKPK